MNDRTARTAATLPRWKKVLFSLVLFLIIAGTLEGAAQIYLRVARGYAGGAFLQYEFDPYKNINLARNWRDTRGVTHNAQGFRRVEEVELNKPDGTFRIFLMGASTAYGLGGLFPHLQTEFAVLDNSETIDAYLEELLADQLPYAHVEVINAGIPSVWTHHSLIYLNQRILHYEPDMILFLDGFNDHYQYEAWYDQFDSYAQTEQASDIMGPPTLSALIRMNGWWLFRKSAFVHVAVRAAGELKTMLANRGAPPPIDLDSALAQLEVNFRNNALKMIERNALILQHEEIPTIVMLQPLLILEREHLGRMPPIERELFDFNAGWQGNHEEFMRRATPIISNLIGETVEPLDADFLDLTGLYDESEGQIFTDYAHLTPEGNRILANRVAEAVVARLARESEEASDAEGPS